MKRKVRVLIAAVGIAGALFGSPPMAASSADWDATFESDQEEYSWPSVPYLDSACFTFTNVGPSGLGLPTETPLNIYNEDGELVWEAMSPDAGSGVPPGMSKTVCWGANEGDAYDTVKNAVDVWWVPPGTYTAVWTFFDPDYTPRTMSTVIVLQSTL